MTISMMVLLIIGCTGILSVGLFHILCGATDAPSGRTDSAMRAAVRLDGAERPPLLEDVIRKVGMLFVPLIHLDALKRSALDNTLKIAEMNMTPEHYIGCAIARALLFMLITIPLWFLSPMFLVFGVGFGALYGFYKYQEVQDRVKKRQRRIEREVPRFAAAMAQSIKIERNVLNALNSYRRIAGHDLGAELDKTIADMMTGNYETALKGMEFRVGSPMMSDVIRGLIGTYHGENQDMYFQTVCWNLHLIEQAELEKEAMKRPRKMQKYSMFMMVCILIIYAVVLVTEVLTSIAVLF